MKHRIHPRGARRAATWLVGLALLLAAGAAAWAQQDPPGRVARLNEQQGTVSFSPAGDDSWYDAMPNRPITTGDRLWTDRNARAELYVDSTAVRMDDRTLLAVSELDDDSARFTATQGRLQLRAREAPAGQRLEVDTANLAVVVETPGDYRIEVDPVAGTTRVAVAAGGVTLYGENGESMALGAHQQLTVSGRQLAAVSGAPVRAGDDGFDRWVAERDRLEDQSISARFVSRDMLGYQQLDRYGDWQSDATYGNVWIPRGVDADWAPYRDGQWADIEPWGWTWIDAAPWGFAPSHYGRWARIGPRWAWVPGRANTRPVYAPALVGFVGGGLAGNGAGAGRPGVGWFPLAPGETWRPGFRASQRYIDEVNRAVAYQRQLARADYLHRNTPGALSLVPVDIFARGPIARRDFLRTPEDRLAQLPIATAMPVLPPRGERNFGGFGRAASALPPPDLRGRQQHMFPQAQQGQQAQQVQQLQQLQQLQSQQRAAQALQLQQLQQQRFQQSQQLQQAQQLQQMQQMPQMQQREALRQQQELQQRAAQAQAQQQFQLQLQQQQQAVRAQQEMQQRAAQAQAQAQQFQLQQQQQQQALRAQQEMQQRAAQAQAQAQQLQLQQQQQQQALRAQQEMQQRAAQAQAQQLQLVQQQQALRAQQQMQQQEAMRQAQEHQQRALQQMQQQQRSAGDMRQRWSSRDSAQQGDRP